MTKVGNIMSTDILTLRKEAKFSDAVKLMASKSQQCVVIVEKEKPIGIITTTDVIRNFVKRKVSPKQEVRELMSSPVTTIRHDASLELANKVLDTKHFRRYPIVGKTTHYF